jgi:hypothetical protein
MVNGALNSSHEEKNWVILRIVIMWRYEEVSVLADVTRVLEEIDVSVKKMRAIYCCV